MIIGKFSKDQTVTVLQQNNFRGQILIGRNQSNWKCILFLVVTYADVLTQRNDISTFDWTFPTMLFWKQLNSLLKLKAVIFKYYQYPVN